MNTVYGIVFKQEIWKLLLMSQSYTGLSVNILRAGDKSPVQERFLKTSVGDLLPALRFLGGFYNFCNFVIILSLM